MGLRVRLLGNLEVLRDGIPIKDWRSYKYNKALLATLISNRGKPFTRDDLTRTSPDKKTIRNLEHRISDLRKILEPDKPGRESQYIIRSGNAYYFSKEADCTVDLEEFNQHCNQAQRFKEERKWREAIEQYRKAEELYQGDFFTDENIDFKGLQRLEDCIFDEREKYRDMLFAVFNNRASCHRELNENDEARSYDRQAQLLEEKVGSEEPSEDTKEPFVGREKELRDVEGLFKRTVAGASWLVLVEGDAGVGKTGFVRELERRFKNKACVLWGFCTQQDRPRGHIIDAICHLIDHPQKISARDKGLHKLLCELMKQLPSDSHRNQLIKNVPRDVLRSVSPKLVHHVSEVGGEVLSEALTLFFVELSQARTVMVILEDIHLAGDSTLQYLKDHLSYCDIHGSSRRGVLWICTYRPEKLDSWRSSFDSSQEQKALDIRLRGLSWEDVGVLIQKLTGKELVEAELKVLHNDTRGGYPLYIVQKVAPQVKAGGDPLASLELVWQSRWSELSDNEKNILGWAAIIQTIRPSFTINDLEQLIRNRDLNCPKKELRSLLNQLKQKWWVKEEQEGPGYALAHEKVGGFIRKKMDSPTQADMKQRLAHTIEIRL